MAAKIIPLSSLSHDAIIDLYKIDLSPAGFPVVLYTTNCFNDAVSQSLQWGGNTWDPRPIDAVGFEYTGQGTLPTPTLTIANIFGEISALCREYDDMLGARFTRYRVFSSDLGITSSEMVCDPEIWFIERKTSEDANQVQFELNSALDLSGFKLPSRPMLANSCSWLSIGGFRGPYCQYSGSVTSCDGRLSTCRTLGNSLRYGGFPGLNNTRTG